MTKNKLYTIYYTLLATVLLTGVIQTVFEGSLHIAHGRKVSQLEQEKKTLLQKQSDLQNQLALELSFSTIDQYTTDHGYYAISHPISMGTTAHSIASR